MKKIARDLLVPTMILLLFNSCRELDKRRMVRELGESSTARRAAVQRKKWKPDRGSGRIPEFRAVWMSRFSYKTPEDIRKAVKNLHDYNFNALVFQVRGNGTVFFNSSLEPWSDELGGKDPGWDPLAVALEEAHSAGIQLHAWINTFPAWQGQKPPRDPSQLWNRHRSWFMVPYFRRGKPPRGGEHYSFLSPCIPEARNHIASVAAELAERYPVDGIHFDFIRFPGMEYTYDKMSLEAFQREYGKEPEKAPDLWSGFRRQSVTRLLEEAREAIHAKRPNLIVSAATWANYNEGSTHYFQDAHGWMAKGLLDISMPMIYRISPDTFQKLVFNHSQSRHGRAVYPGIGCYLIQDSKYLIGQVMACRDLGTNGLVLFEYSSLFKDHLPGAMADDLLKGPFREPVPVPDLHWLKIEDDDSLGPLVTNVRMDPPVPAAGQPFHILCDITDRSGVRDVSGGSFDKGPYLLYDTTATFRGGRELPLSRSGGDTFITDGEIVIEEPGVTLFIRIKAWDEDVDLEEGGEADRAPGESETLARFIPHPVKSFRFAGSFGEEATGLQYPDTDASGRLWVIDGVFQRVLIMNPDGFFSSISPITTALDENGETINLEKPAGLAIDKKRDLVYVTAGNRIFRYYASTGKPLPAFTTSCAVCGDAALDSEGNVYITSGIRRRWTKITRTGKPVFEKEVGPFPPDHELYNNPSLTRGIAVAPDGETVYLACEEDGVVDRYRRIQGSDPQQYKHDGVLTGISIGTAAIDLFNGERIFISEGDGTVRILLPDGTEVEDIAGKDRPILTPRGVAMSPDGKILYVVQTGHFSEKTFIQKWIH